MEFLALGVVIVVAILVKRRLDARKPALGRVSSSGSNSSSDDGERGDTQWNHNKPPIPSGHQIYLKGLAVAGVQHRKDDAARLAVASSPSLFWRKDRDNEHDANAIAIYGRAGGHDFHVGYVDKETAAKLNAWPDFADLNVRFEKAGYRNDWVELNYQVTGPKARKKEFEEHTKR